jgi:polyphosphate kinase 2 (PPK2 family)
MIVTLAGRRIDAQNAPVARFPLEKATTVHKRIQKLLQESQATVLVSSAACGADLLALDAAGKLGIRRRIILSFEPKRFRKASVTDRPGDWGTLYDRIIREVESAGDLVLLNEEVDDEAAFMRANTAILDEAQKLAHEATREAHAKAEDLLAVLVWDGKPRDERDITAAFGEEARARAIPMTEILTQD